MPGGEEQAHGRRPARTIDEAVAPIKAAPVAAKRSRDRRR